MIPIELPHWFSRIPVRDLFRASHATALKVISTLITLAFGILGARLLGTDTFGAYVSIFVVAGLVSVASSVGLPALMMRELAASRGNGDRRGLKPVVQGLVLINGVIGAALVVALVMGAWVAALVLTFCLLGNVAGLLGAVFIAYERVLLASWIGSVVRPGLALVTLIALGATITPSYLLPLVAQIVGVVGASTVLLLLWNGEPLSNARRAFSCAWWSDDHPTIVKSGLIFAGTQLLINLTTQVDILILAAMASPEDVAHYYAAARAALVVGFFYGATGLLAEPALTRLHAAKDHDDVQALATRTAITGFFVTVIAVIVAVVLAPWYLGLYGPSFAVAFPSFCIFAGGIVVWSFFGPAEPMLRAIRGERSLMWITASVLILNVAVSVALVPVLGISGAAIGTAIQFAVYGALLARAVKRQSNYRSNVILKRQPSDAEA